MKFSRPIISIQWIQWIPRKTPLVLRFNASEQWQRGGFSREKSKDPPFEKAGKSPKTKSHGQVARRLSKFDTRLAEVRWKNGSIPNVSLLKFDSCGSPFEDLEPIHAAPTTPLKPRGNTSRLRHRSISILDKRNIRFLGNLCVRDLENLPFLSHRF